MCYNSREVSAMEEERSEELQQETPAYVPRPKWLVWLARIALVAFILLLIMYYVNLFRGGV